MATKNELWVEKLDDALRDYIKNKNTVRSKAASDYRFIQWISTRHSRMLALDALLTIAIDALEAAPHLTRHDYESQREFKWALAQFTPFDYKLIYLIYNRWSFEFFSSTLLHKVKQSLNEYLVNNDTASLERLLSLMEEETQKEASFSGRLSHEEAIVYRQRVAELYDDVWALGVASHVI